MLQIDAFNINSFTMLFHFTDDICSPNIFFIDENADSVIHLYLYPCFFFYRFISLNCSNTDSFRDVQLMLFLMDEFFLTFITGVIFNSSRYSKLSLESSHCHLPILFEYCYSQKHCELIPLVFFHHEHFLLLRSLILFELSLCLLYHLAYVFKPYRKFFFIF